MAGSGDLPQAPLPEALLSRVEDAGLNASAPPQQHWVDGWLVRLSPGKAKRARCIQPVADGRLPVDERLALCAALYHEAGLQMVVRITPFSRPAGLDAWLAQRGWTTQDDTRVMVCRQLPTSTPVVWPDDGLQLVRLAPADYSEVVGELRGSPPQQRQAHAQRLTASPVPYQGWAVQQGGGGPVVACAQMAREADMVGLYDVFTHPAWRGRGLAGQLCSALLGSAASAGARLAYLQVEGDNLAARRVYQRLGFADAYSYHYRVNPSL